MLSFPVVLRTAESSSILNNSAQANTNPMQRTKISILEEFLKVAVDKNKRKNK